MRVFHGGVVEAYQERDFALAALGYEIVLIVPKWFRELPDVTIAKARDDIIRVVPVGLYGPRRNPFYFYNPIEVARWMKITKPQVLDLHEEPYSLAAFSILLARALSGSKPALIFRSSQNVYKTYPFPFSRIQQRILGASKEAYVPSEQARAVLEQKGFPHSISVVGNGVALSEEIVSLSSNASSRPIRFLYVGRFTERKGVVELVEAALTMGPSVELTLVGSGPMLERLLSLVADSGNGLNIHFFGSVPHAEVAKFMQEADVICVPSHELDGWSEQFSRALVEGMASFCVPLVSTSGALPEVSGSIRPPVPWGNYSAIVSEMRALIDLTNLDDLKAAAHQRAITNYSWEATSRQISAIYERVVPA